MEITMKPQQQFLSLAVALALSPAALATGAMQAADLDTIVDLFTLDTTGENASVLQRDAGAALNGEAGKTAA